MRGDMFAQKVSAYWVLEVFMAAANDVWIAGTLEMLCHFFQRCLRGECFVVVDHLVERGFYWHVEVAERQGD